MPSEYGVGGQEEATSVEQYPIIPKVPLFMREENKESNKDYDPIVVSLGPYHHGKPKLKFVEDFKLKSLDMFIEKSGLIPDDLFNEIQQNIMYARNCYVPESTIMYNDEQFARMMVLDACFILNYIGPDIRSLERNKPQTITHLGASVYFNIRRDMFLLENQVPFWILDSLTRLRYKCTVQDALIKEVEDFSFKMLFKNEKGELEEPDQTNKLRTNACHLLEIFRRVTVTGKDHAPISDNHGRCEINDLVSCIDRSCCRKENNDKIQIRGLYVFRSTTDLKSKGIEFRASEIQSFKGVRFNPTKFCRSAELKLPIAYIDMNARVFFKNVIAYELSPYVNCADKSVTSYVDFMKLIVVTKEDVKELRENKIIINDLGSDEEVVQLYKSLSTYGQECNSSYWDVKMAIQHHYNSISKTWMADLRSTYFQNPWTAIALAGTIFLLCLDIIQTYYAMQPSDDHKCCSNLPSSQGGF